MDDDYEAAVGAASDYCSLLCDIAGDMQQLIEMWPQSYTGGAYVAAGIIASAAIDAAYACARDLANQYARSMEGRG